MKTDYQALNRELEEIVLMLESPDVDIDEALKTYERGIEVAKQLENYLKTAENKISKIQASWDKKSAV